MKDMKKILKCIKIMANGRQCIRPSVDGSNYCSYHEELRFASKSVKKKAAAKKKAAEKPTAKKAAAKKKPAAKKKAVAKKK